MRDRRCYRREPVSSFLPGRVCEREIAIMRSAKAEKRIYDVTALYYECYGFRNFATALERNDRSVFDPTDRNRFFLDAS